MIAGLGLALSAQPGGNAPPAEAAIVANVKFYVFYLEKLHRLSCWL